MIPQYQQRGTPVSPAAFNALIDEVRSSQLTAITGGTFQRSISGTNINVAQQPIGSGVSSASIECPFKVTDVSELKNGVLTLKIQVSQNPIIGTISEDFPSGRYPEGMSADPDALPYIEEITQAEGVEYVYVNILVNQLNEIYPSETAITVSREPELLTGNSTYQRFLIAVVEKQLDDESKPYISRITNACPLIFQRPAPTCPFLVEDDSRDGVCRITVRSGLVSNTEPDDMTLTNNFSLTVSPEQSWWVVYCGMVVVDGVIQTGPGNISIFTDTEYQDSTSDYVYFKLAEFTVGYRADSTRYVDWVLNTCAVPFVATGGGSAACAYFKVTDASQDTVLKVKVAQNLIAGRWPQGMGIGFPDFILEISGSSYIYAGISWDIENLTIAPEPEAITILQSNELMENTSTMEYILLSTILTGGSPLAITHIANVCAQPIPNPCSLNWTA